MATRTTVQQVIDEFRTTYDTNVERGEAFEKLMVAYFRLDPTLAAEYDLVERWPNWNHNEGTHDSGIDLVARITATGEWTAIQCKFFDPESTLQKAQIDSFFTASGRSWDGVRFVNRIIISTTDRWSSHAETALSQQQIPVQRIGVPDLAESPIDWMQQSPGRVRAAPGGEVRAEAAPEGRHRSDQGRVHRARPGQVDQRLRHGQDLHLAEAGRAAVRGERRQPEGSLLGAFDLARLPIAARVDGADADDHSPSGGVL
ncbi:MAG TPA: hypothetical protein GXZ45_12560 [Propionibacterium sp.]|nr:hypothetical protein [Propionibacterium sp.]